jgi:hypothetical protein
MALACLYTLISDSPYSNTEDPHGTSGSSGFKIIAWAIIYLVRHLDATPYQTRSSATAQSPTISYPYTILDQL